MGNANAPFGFRPCRHVTGLGQRLGKYSIASGLAETFTIGDLVKSTGMGKNIQKAGVTDAILGVFAGWYLESQPGLSGSNFAGSSNGQIPWNKTWTSGQTVPAGVEVVALVHDDPLEIFEVQCSGAIAATDVNRLVDSVDAAPNTVFGAARSTIEAPDGTGVQFKIEEVVEKPTRSVDANNNTTGWGMSGYGTYAIARVRAVKHEKLGTALSVAV